MRPRPSGEARASGWSVADGHMPLSISLALPANDTVEVIVAPDGERTALVDGEAVTGLVEPAVDLALRELEQRGRLRFQAFVARADKVDDDRWAADGRSPLTATL